MDISSSNLFQSLQRKYVHQVNILNHNVNNYNYAFLFKNILKIYF